MCRITLARIIPALYVETKEELQILHYSQLCAFAFYEWTRTAYTHGVCLRAIHVPKKEISKFDRIQSSKEQSKLKSVLVFLDLLSFGTTYIGICPPLTAPVIENWGRHE